MAVAPDSRLALVALEEARGIPSKRARLLASSWSTSGAEVAEDIVADVTVAVALADWGSGIGVAWEVARSCHAAGARKAFPRKTTLVATELADCSSRSEEGMVIDERGLGTDCRDGRAAFDDLDAKASSGGFQTAATAAPSPTEAASTLR